MTDRQPLGDYSVTSLTLAAGATFDLVATGTMFVLTECSGTIKVRVDGVGGSKAMQAGMGWETLGAPFGRLQLENDTAGALTLTLAVGYGRFIDNRASIGQPITVNGQVDPGDVVSYHGASTMSTGGSIFAAVAAGNPAGIAVKNVGPVRFYLSFGAVDTTNGYPLDPGEEVTLRRGTNSPLYAATLAGTGKAAWIGWSKS